MLHLALLETLRHGLVFVNTAIKHHGDFVQLFIEYGILLGQPCICLLEASELLLFLQPTFLGRTPILHESFMRLILVLIFAGALSVGAAVLNILAVVRFSHVAV